MATPYKVNNNQAKNQPVKVDSSWFSRHKTIIIAIAIIVAFVTWFNSDYWPWPFQWQRDNRLQKVLDICTDNESSSECKNIQKRFNMTFRYCYKYGDFGSIYAVAWEGNSSQPPEQKSTGGNIFTIPLLNTYYGCKEHV